MTALILEMEFKFSKLYKSIVFRCYVNHFLRIDLWLFKDETPLTLSAYSVYYISCFLLLLLFIYVVDTGFAFWLGCWSLALLHISTLNVSNFYTS